VFDFEPERRAQSPHEQTVADQRVIDELGLARLIYGWREHQPAEPRSFQMGHHAWELYHLPEEAEEVARAALARTSRRHVHWLLDWPGRDRVLLRRPPPVDSPAIGGWSRVRRHHELEQRMQDAVATVARLDATLEQVEVLEPLYVERARLAGHDWKRTVALLSDGTQIAICPWDWYEFIVSDFVDSCADAVRREAGS
jgi:hypothetical protein